MGIRCCPVLNQRVTLTVGTSWGRHCKITRDKEEVGVVPPRPPLFFAFLYFIFLFLKHYKSNEGPLGECLKQKISHLKLLHPEITIVNSLTNFLFRAFEITGANWLWERKAPVPVLLRYFPRRPPDPGWGAMRCGSRSWPGRQVRTSAGTEGRDVSGLSPLTTSLLCQAELAEAKSFTHQITCTFTKESSDLSS